MANDFVQTMIDARVDARSLSDFMFYPASEMITRRLAPSIHTLNYYLDYFSGLEALYSQESGTVTVNGVEIKTVRQAMSDAIDDVLLGEYQEAIRSDLNAQKLDTGITATASLGGFARTQADKNSETVSVKNYYRESDQGDWGFAFNRASESVSAVKFPGAYGINTISASIEIPDGHYTVRTPIIWRNNIHFKGAGSGSVAIEIDHNGDGFSTEADAGYLANMHMYGMRIVSGGTANIAVKQSKTIRNCLLRDVVAEGFNISFSFNDSWTSVLDRCMSLNAKQHHVYGGTGTGGLHIYGGRYDASSSHGVYIDSPSAELVITDAAIQSSSKAAVYVADAITTELNQCFLENNCYNSTEDYYVVIKRKEVYTKSSATINNCVINNTDKPDRNGLGIIYVDNIESFTYNERWSRNDVSVRPVITDSVKHVKMTFGTWQSRLTSLTHIKPNNEASATVEQVNRPFGVYGADMKSTTGGYYPQNYAAALIGKPESGVALGTYSQKGAIQAYGQSGLLFINPEEGEIAFGSTGICSIKSGTNTFYGTFREAAQAGTSDIRPNPTTGFVAVDTTTGQKDVNLGDISAEYGRRITVAKSKGDTNTLRVFPKSGETIEGAANISLTTPYQTVTLIGAGGTWLVVG